MKLLEVEKRDMPHGPTAGDATDDVAHLMCILCIGGRNVKMCVVTVSSEKTRQQLELSVAKLQQQLNSSTQQSAHNDKEMKVALHNEKQSRDADVERLTADKVCMMQ